MRKITVTYKEFFNLFQKDNKIDYYVKIGNNQFTKIKGAVHKKSDTYFVKFDNDYNIIVGDNHMFMDLDNKPIAAKNLKQNDKVKTITGDISVKEINFNKKNDDVYDIWIDSPHWYINDEKLGVYHHNTMLALYCMKAYLDKYEDSIALFYDSEFGTPSDYLATMGINPERVIHIPVTNLEELKFDMVSRLESIERGDKVFIMVDSIGNLASKREYDNAISENSAKDMSRAGDIKSLFRIVTPHITMKDIPCIMISHVYSEMGLFPKTIVSGGCLVAGTKIPTQRGLIAIEDIIVGDLVNTRAGKNVVTHTWKPETLFEGFPICYRLVFSDGYKVSVSANHRFLDINDNWVYAKDMITSNGDTVPVVLKGFDGARITLVDIVEVGTKPVYDITVDSLNEYRMPNGILSHNSGVMYASNNCFIITKSQEKEGTELVGYNFTINIEKSRYVKEKSKLSFTVKYNEGISKYSGLLDIALESGDVIKPSNGWYQRKGTENKLRLKDTNTKEFWDPILNDDNFKTYVKEKFQLGYKQRNPVVKDNVAAEETEE